MIALRRNAAVYSFAAILLLASLFVASVESNRVHTDDGCQVELHCFACHWGFATTGIETAQIVYGPVLTNVDSLLPFPTLLPVEPAPPRKVSRGPPSS